MKKNAFKKISFKIFLLLLATISIKLLNLNLKLSKEKTYPFVGLEKLVVKAQGVQNMEAIPGQPRTNDFITYLISIYKFGIAISAMLAVFMISYGAFIYIFTSAGNAAKMGDAKDMIFNAIFGLVLALVAFLLLFVINPDLVKGKLKSVPTIEKILKEQAASNP